MKKLLAILLCLVIPSISFANPRICNLSRNQRAPYDGYLFDYEAYAVIEAEKQALVKQCELTRQKDRELFDLSLQATKKTYEIQKEAQASSFQVQINQKEDAIKKLQTKLDSIEPCQEKAWFGFGVAAGAVISTILTIVITNKL